MWFFLILVVGGVILFLVVSSKQRQEREAQEAAERQQQLALERFQELARVVNESLKIIDDTKNLDTLKSRVSVAEDRLKTMEAIESEGYSFSTRPASETRRRLPDEVNNRLSELGKQLYDDIMAKKDSYASDKTAITAISKVQQKLVELREAVYDYGSNNESTRDYLQGLHDSLKNEVLYGQVKSIIEKADREDFKGNRKKAHDLYFDALHMLKTAGVDFPESASQREYVESKIAEAGS